MRILLSVLVMFGGFGLVNIAMQVVLLRLMPGLYLRSDWIRFIGPICGLVVGGLAVRALWRMTRPGRGRDAQATTISATLPDERPSESARALMTAVLAVGTFIIIMVASVLALQAVNPYSQRAGETLGLMAIGAACVSALVGMRYRARTAAAARTNSAAPHSDSGFSVLAIMLQVLAFAVMFPPFGAIMMFIEIPWRRLSHADVALALIVPLYGWIRFWTW